MKTVYNILIMKTKATILQRIKKRLRYLCYGVGLSVLVVFLLQSWCAWQVYCYAQTLPEPVQHADAAVVLGAAAWGNNPSPVFKERINHALTLYQTGHVDKLIFTGGTPKEGYLTEAEVARKFALKQGVPEHDIVFENTSKDTVQNLANTRLLMQQHKINHIIIVSDPYHMARAMTIARDLGIRAEPSPTPTSRYLAASGKARWKFFLQESYGLLAYKLLRLVN